MRKLESDLLEDVQKCMTDPIYDITHNFSLKKSKEFYEKYAKEWERGNYQQNPADAKERYTFPFGSLEELATVSIEAQNLHSNMKKANFIKGLDWRTYGQNIIVGWHRLKTFDEWLHDGLKDALTQHYECPEDGIRKTLHEKIGGYSQNVDIHLFVEGKIDEEILTRLANFEKPQKIEGRDIEKDIEEAIKALNEDEVKKNVTVLTLKM